MNKCYYILSFLLCFSAFGQQKKTYDDKYGVQGEVSYSGKWNDTLLPQQGRYSLKWRTIEEDTLTTFAIAGNLQNHLPHGRWTWEEAGWDYTIEPGKDIHPNFKAAGLHAIWVGEFTKGLANGFWRYGFGEPIVRPESRRTPLRITATFKNGKFTRKFEVVDERNTEQPVQITGFTDDNGIATGTWVYSYQLNDQPVVEQRIYDSGILTGIITKFPNHTDTLDFYMIQQKMKLLSDANTRIIIGERDFSNDGEFTESQALYKHYIHDHFLCGWSHPSFPFQTQRSAPIFKRLAYPLSEEELAFRTEIEQLMSQLEATVDASLGLGNVSINRNRNKSLDLAVAALETAQQRIAIINEFIAYSYEPMFIYQDRKNGALESWIKKINAHREVKGVVYLDTMTSFSVIPTKQDIYFVFQSLLENSRRVAEELKPHLETMRENFELFSREGELKQLEEELAQDLILLDSMYSDQLGLAHHVHQFWISDYLQKRLVEYAQTKDYEAAKLLSRALLTKMDSLLNWADEWQKLDNLEKDVREAYINFAYNPYTGAYDIELPLKKRFVTNMLVRLTPWMKEQLIQVEKWDDFARYFWEIKQLKKDLIAFAQMNDRPDRRMERKLRKESQPDKMLRQFKQHMGKNRD